MRRIGLPILLGILLASCGGGGDDVGVRAPLAVDADTGPAELGSWELAGHAVLRLSSGLLVLEQRGLDWRLADQVAGTPAVAEAGDRLVYARRGDGVGLSSLEAWELGDGGDWTGPRGLAEQADRPAISPDGERVAYVSGKSGIASIWLTSFDDGDPIQLTNVGLTSPALSEAPLDGPRHTPGQPPAGFVPPPRDGSLRFDGDHLRWEAPDGPRGVALP
jgi:TolB protein